MNQAQLAAAQPGSLLYDLALVNEGSYSKVSGDVLDHVVYDELLFAQTTARATSTFFTQQIGQAFGAGVKTRNETNLQDSGKLPAGQGMIFREVGFAAKLIVGPTDVDAQTIVAALINLLQFSSFRLQIAGREFDLEFPGTLLLAPIMVRGRGTVVDATDRLSNTGEMLCSGWIPLKLPIVLGELVSFNVTQTTGSPIAANQTILNTASDALFTQVASLQMRIRGTLVRSK
jgi:hypothetical protein